MIKLKHLELINDALPTTSTTDLMEMVRIFVNIMKENKNESEVKDESSNSSRN